MLKSYQIGQVLRELYMRKVNKDQKYRRVQKTEVHNRVYTDVEELPRTIKSFEKFEIAFKLFGDVWKLLMISTVVEITFQNWSLGFGKGSCVIVVRKRVNKCLENLCQINCLCFLRERGFFITNRSGKVIKRYKYTTRVWGRAYNFKVMRNKTKH